LVTSLVLQDYLGGEVGRRRLVYAGNRESHFFNILPDGQELDPTGGQYPEPVIFEEAPLTLKGYSSIRERLLDSPTAAHKYALLRWRVGHALAGLSFEP